MSIFYSYLVEYAMMTYINGVEEVLERRGPAGAQASKCLPDKQPNKQ